MKKRKLFLPLCVALIATSCSNLSVTTLLKKRSDDLSYNYDDLQSEILTKNLEKLKDFSLRVTESYNNHFDDGIKNSCVSPFSIFMLLSMLSECSSGESKEEIISALNINEDDLNEFTKILYKTFTKNIFDANGKASLIERVSNSIWIDESITVNDTCLNNLSNYYYVDTFHTSFSKNNKRANSDFSKYVNDETNGFLNKEFNFSANTVILLSNIIYLKEVWNDFGEELNFHSEEISFKEKNGTIKNTKMLSSLYSLGQVKEDENFKSFYINTAHDLKLYFIKPNELNYKLSIDDYSKALNEPYIIIDEELEKKYLTNIIFPEMNIDGDVSIKNLLIEDFGISEVFNDGDANFKPLTNTSIYVNDINHVTKLKVDKTGIEGAALTVEDFATESAPLYKNVYSTFVIDNAFEYFLTDNRNNIIFSGAFNSL